MNPFPDPGSYLLKQARILDPANGVDHIGDLAVADGRVVPVTAVAGRDGLVSVDLRGHLLMPGLIDLHVHFRDPGQTEKEDLATGAAAAAAGGFTTVVMMPNTRPPIDRVERAEALRVHAADQAAIRTLITACITHERRGVALTDLEALAQLPAVVAFTDDGSCVQDLSLMRQAMSRLADLDVPLCDHCEDAALQGKGVVRAGPVAERLGVPGVPSEAESEIVKRNIRLCRQTGCRIHLQHLSCAASVAAVREARQEGLPVSAEVSPHHLLLTVEHVPVLGSNAKMNPPLGTDADRDTLLAALADGTISAIATDHAPHTPAEKALGLQDAPFGIIGLETALPLCLTELWRTGRLSLLELVARFTTGPAEALGLAAGTLSPGAAADLTVVDPEAVYAIDVRHSRSRSRNSPFQHCSVVGKVVGTMVGGRWVFRDGLP